jgi:hypothetical protein
MGDRTGRVLCVVDGEPDFRNCPNDQKRYELARRIGMRHRLIKYISIQILILSCKGNRILLQKPAQRWTVVPGSIVIQLQIGIELTSRKTRNAW